MSIASAGLNVIHSTKSSAQWGALQKYKVFLNLQWRISPNSYHKAILFGLGLNNRVGRSSAFRMQRYDIFYGRWRKMAQDWRQHPVGNWMGLSVVNWMGQSVVNWMGQSVMNWKGHSVGNWIGQSVGNWIGWSVGTITGHRDIPWWDVTLVTLHIITL